MSLTENQGNRVWECMAESEARSMYFGALSARFIKRKQLISGTLLFLASGAAATIGASTRPVIPLIFSIVAAILSAYSIAVGLDRRVVSTVKLHCDWAQIATDYERLWNNWQSVDADNVLTQIQARDLAASAAGLDLGQQDEKLIEKWSDRAYERYREA